MGTITINNRTSSAIHVRITPGGSSDEERFFDINPGGSENWGRGHWQVCFVLRDDTGETETFVVKPGDSRDSDTSRIVRRFVFLLLITVIFLLLTLFVFVVLTLFTLLRPLCHFFLTSIN
ncbi:hypothetical protein AZE42_07957 [Rhizopogon vesiculosus]|uniref:Uncharacterized protein n=1 Tax=Rhizopogon vesiculosus TaxID=180088 RepID=A0A1J8PW04_9AGAM|nr:hypothetical protein AZE42_07957 [Rhizopogon vesiculosus]